MGNLPPSKSWSGDWGANKVPYQTGHWGSDQKPPSSGKKKGCLWFFTAMIMVIAFLVIVHRLFSS